MLTKKTVLVLGAGASAPFGFPTGIQLAERVVQDLRAKHAVYSHLTEVGYPADHLRAFCDQLQLSGKDSVDAFLEHRPDFWEIGKAATAAVLLPYEEPTSLFRFDDNNWLRYLYNNLNTSFEAFGSNKLAILTFNYDRTAEFFLFTALRNTYKKGDDEIRKALAAIPVIHLHGRLGYLPWEKEDSVAFDGVVTEDRIRSGVKNIKIIHEDISDGRDGDFELGKKLLADAEQIFFLGFGYNRTNVERLGIASMQPGRAWGTCLGLRPREQDDVFKQCDGRVNLVDDDCHTMLRDRIGRG